MHNKSRFRTHVGRNRYPIWYFLVLIVCALLLDSCAPKVVTVDRYHNTETLRTVRDSIYYSDTVLLDARGDTVIVEVTKWRTRTTTQHDTIRVVDTTAVDGQALSALSAEVQRLRKTNADTSAKLSTTTKQLSTATAAAVILPILILLLCALVIRFITSTKTDIRTRAV